MSTKIEWTDERWNPVTGCSLISEGCQNCYAKRMANRLRGRYGYPEDDPFQVTLHPDRLELPFQWKKPKRIFVNSMGDLFHEDVPFEFIDRVFAVISIANNHRYQLLTKRPQRMLEYLSTAFDRVFSLVYSVNYEQRRETAEIKPVRNRNQWKNLEDRQTTREGGEARGGLLSRCQSKPLSEGARRIPNERRLSFGDGDYQWNKNSDGGTPSCMDRETRNHPGEINNQSQEWHKRRQSPGKSRTSNIQRTTATCPRCSEGKTSPSNREQASQNPSLRSGCDRNASTTHGWYHGERHCKNVRHDTKGDKRNSQQENLETHLEWPLPNVWLGVTAENQETADERIPILFECPAAVRFVSVEPCIGPIDFTNLYHKTSFSYYQVLKTIDRPGGRPALDWIVVGAETGPGARPMDPKWARNIRDQCKAANVPFFMKKMSGGKRPPEDLMIREFPQTQGKKGGL